MNRRLELGRKGETDALEALKKRGYRILERNYRTPSGEIDIIAKDRKTIAFIEVKTRRSSRFGGPKQAITVRKKRALSMAALYYLKSIGQSDARARFDVVAISLERGIAEIEIIQNAFELSFP